MTGMRNEKTDGAWLALGGVEQMEVGWEEEREGVTGKGRNTQ